MDASEWARRIVGYNFKTRKIAPGSKLIVAYSTPHIFAEVTVRNMDGSPETHPVTHKKDQRLEDLTFYELVTSKQPQLVTAKMTGQDWETTRNKLFVPGDPKEYPAIRMRMRRSRQNWWDMGHAHFAAPEISFIAIRGISRATAEKKTELTIRLAQFLIARDAASEQQLKILERFTRTELKSVLPEHLLELADMSPQKRKAVLNGVEIFTKVSLPG